MEMFISLNLFIWKYSGPLAQFLTLSSWVLPWLLQRNIPVDFLFWVVY